MRRFLPPSDATPDATDATDATTDATDATVPSLVTVVLPLGVLAVSTAAIFIRLADAPGVVVALYRLLIASLLLLPWTLRSLARTPLTFQNAPYTILAGLCLAVHFATWISSLSYTSVTASAALVNTNPLWVALFSWLFLGLAPPLTVLIGAVLAVLGGALIGFDGSGVGSQPAFGQCISTSRGSVGISLFATWTFGAAARFIGAGICGQCVRSSSVGAFAAAASVRCFLCTLPSGDVGLVIAAWRWCRR